MDGLQYDQIGIEKLNLTVRSYNSLKRARINTLGRFLRLLMNSHLILIQTEHLQNQEIQEQKT